MEQTGKIQIATYSDGRWRRVGTFLDIRDKIRVGSEQGLLGLAFAPNYSTSHRFYVNYTRKSDGATVIAEFKRRASDSTKACKSCFRQVLRILPAVQQPQRGHAGLRAGRPAVHRHG